MSTDTRTTSRGAVFRVLDAIDAPHGGRILRLRIQSGEAPAVRDLKGARLKGVSPDGREAHARVSGFAVLGGKPTDERLRRTGRIDVRVADEGSEEPIALRWEVTPA